MPKKDASADAPSVAEVVRELTNALGKPKKERGILRFKAPADAKAAKPWITRVHAAGGAASLAEAHPARELWVVDGPPSGLMHLVTYVSWHSKSTLKLLDKLHAEVGVTISNINYTGFVMTLGKAPKDPAAYAKGFGKLFRYIQGKEEHVIRAALQKRRWKT